MSAGGVKPTAHGAGDGPCAVVIAAGAGTRLRRSSGDDKVIKPLVSVGKVPLVVRALATLHAAGARRAALVVGYRAADVTAAVLGHPLLEGLEIEQVHNPDWSLRNGISVLAARHAVGASPFFLSMADHLYPEDVPRALLAAPPAGDELVLAVDRRVDEVPDPEDAMWVALGPDGGILDIAKGLERRDAVDTGVFLSSPALFDALAAERDERGGDCALADGVRRMARAGRARTVDVSHTWWIDVDTHENLEAAERLLAGPPRAASYSQRLGS